jgi:hypothetical protein
VREFFVQSNRSESEHFVENICQVVRIDCYRCHESQPSHRGRGRLVGPETAQPYFTQNSQWYDLVLPLNLPVHFFNCREKSRHRGSVQHRLPSFDSHEIRRERFRPRERDFHSDGKRQP